jgi:hypothetical protein
MVDRQSSSPESTGEEFDGCFFCEQRRSKPRTLLSHPLTGGYSEAVSVAFVRLFIQI